MSTRSFIGTIKDREYRGRYVHNDGYPSHMGETLAELLARRFNGQGVDAAVAELLAVLTEQHYGWSLIQFGYNEPLGVGYDDGRFELVPGIGRAYTTHRNQSSPEDWVTGIIGEASEPASWLDWGYVFDLDAGVLHVLHVGSYGLTRVAGTIPLDGLRPTLVDWGVIERRGYGS
jgi:hypothetical protein